MANVRVKLHTILQKQTPEGRIDTIDLTLKKGSSIRDLVALLNLEISTDEILFVINHQNADLDDEIKDGDEIHLIPAIAGGQY